MSPDMLFCPFFHREVYLCHVLFFAEGVADIHQIVFVGRPYDCITVCLDPFLQIPVHFLHVLIRADAHCTCREHSPEPPHLFAPEAVRLNYGKTQLQIPSLRMKLGFVAIVEYPDVRADGIQVIAAPYLLKLQASV